MTLPKRLVYYFKALPPNTTVPHTELYDLLWRGKEDGGPEKARQTLAVHVCKANKLLNKGRIKGEYRGYRLAVDR